MKQERLQTNEAMSALRPRIIDDMRIDFDPDLAQPRCAVPQAAGIRNPS